MSEDLKTDICVIGGGPAGSTIACRLARLGYSVVVVEKRIFPRPHIGESLTPGVLPLFEVLGIRETIEEQHFLRTEATVLHWPPFRGRKPLGMGLGFQVDRGKFDAVLLEAAEDAGALTMQGARLTGIKRISDGNWNVEIFWHERQIALHCRFIVDASGRGRALGGTKKRCGTPTLALWAYWRINGKMSPHTRVEASEDEWFWGAPLPSGTLNATVFVDPERLSRGLHELGSVENLYRDLLGRSTLLSDCMKGTPVSRTMACDATCYYDEQPVTSDLIRVGEASFSIDPLSSQGVQAALGSSLHAAAVIHTILQRPHAQATAQQFYRERQQDAVTFHRMAASQLYAQVVQEFRTLFWQSRAGRHTVAAEVAPGNSGSLPEKARLRLSAETQISEIACLNDCFIVSKPGVTHPTLPRPVAFLDDVALAPLLNCFRVHPSRNQVINAWSHLGQDRATRILNWVWENGLITEAA